ncbi:MAG: hypothetical protein ACRDTD_19770, partial [Pseudonocardiaceae bacterium]
MASEVAASHSSDLVDIGTVGADIALPPSIPATETMATLVTETLGYRRREARVRYEHADERHLQSHFNEWVLRTSRRGRSSPIEMLKELTELG